MERPAVVDDGGNSFGDDGRGICGGANFLVGIDVVEYPTRAAADINNLLR